MELPIREGARRRRDASQAPVLVRIVDVAHKVVGDADGWNVVKANDALTLSENIAALGEMTLTYHALQTYMKKNRQLPDPDGLSPERRSFAAWAHTWRTTSRPAARKVQVATDPTHLCAFLRTVGEHGFVP